MEVAIVYVCTAHREREFSVLLALSHGACYVHPSCDFLHIAGGAFPHMRLSMVRYPAYYPTERLVTMYVGKVRRHPSLVAERHCPL